MAAEHVTVYQAEWCPYSSDVRQVLTELDVPYLAMPVPPFKPDREQLRELTGSEEIPAVVLTDGTVLAGDTDDIVAALRERFPAGSHAEGHQQQAAVH